MGQLRQQKNNSQRTDATTKDKRAIANINSDSFSFRKL
jgi:hypothetical protein